MAGTMYVDVPVGETVNVRKGPGLSYAKIGTLGRGRAVTYDSIENGWYHITAPLYGYIDGNYLSAIPVGGGSAGGDYATNAYEAYGPSTQVLRRGSQGEAVRNLQITLLRLGYMYDPDQMDSDNVADGIFGSFTEQEVKRFQEDKGLDVDGVVGNKTKEALWNAGGDELCLDKVY